MEGNHHVIEEIAIMHIVFDILGEDFTGVDDNRYIIHIRIFRLMELSNRVFPEVEVFDTFCCNQGGPL